jgi:hypothetical protein
MNWTEIIERAFELLIYPMISALSIYLINLASAKIAELKQKAKNDEQKKYLDMLDNTITSAVMATTQTYVDSLKKQGKFDEEAQKVAFKQTYDAVVAVLSADASKYLSEIVGDLQAYITTKIEATVGQTK